MKGRRSVITGIGLITSLGNTTEETWSHLCEGKSGVRSISRFDPEGMRCQIAGEIRDFDPLQYIGRKDLKKMDLYILYAIGATAQALEDAHITIDESNRDRIGVLIGSGIGGLPCIEEEHRNLLEKGPRAVTPFLITSIAINLAAGQISIKFGARGPNLAVSTACATGTHAIGEAHRMIARGEADAMICGGSEGVITPLAVAGFSKMRAVSGRNDEPERASRPFDRERDGFVLGEGAGVVFLEEREAALARGAHAYAEIRGYGATGDAYHVTSLPDDGEGPIRAMELSLRDARLEPNEITYINAHGTSTPQGDRVETLAIKAVYGSWADHLAVSSNKSMFGHLLGAAGGVETAITALTIDRGIIPPTINYEYPDEECDLDYVPNESRNASIQNAMTNSFGFGGTNACLVLGKA